MDVFTQLDKEAVDDLLGLLGRGSLKEGLQELIKSPDRSGFPWQVQAAVEREQQLNSFNERLWTIGRDLVHSSFNLQFQNRNIRI